MRKWIQHVEKPQGHSDYTKIITQICISNNFSLNLRQMFLEKIVKEESFHVECLDYDERLCRMK
jgi:hypothetical protein